MMILLQQVTEGQLYKKQEVNRACSALEICGPGQGEYINERINVWK
jgi:hypothetical protein